MGCIIKIVDQAGIGRRIELLPKLREQSSGSCRTSSFRIRTGFTNIMLKQEVSEINEEQNIREIEIRLEGTIFKFASPFLSY